MVRPVNSSRKSPTPENENRKVYELFFSINERELRHLCLQRHWYEYTGTKEYNNLLDMANGCISVPDLCRIADEICKHSEETNPVHVMCAIANHACFFDFTELHASQCNQQSKNLLQKFADRLKFWK